MRFDVHPTMMKQKQGAPRGRTLKIYRQERYVQQGFPRREGPVSLCWWCDETVPPAIGKLAFAQQQKPQ